MQLNELEQMLKEPEKPKFSNGPVVWLKWDGKELNLTQWARELNISIGGMCKRHKKYKQGLIEYSDLFR